MFSGIVALDSVFAVVLVLICALVYKYTRRPKNFPPGPPRLPILGSLPFLSKPAAKGFYDMSKKYGPIFSAYFGNYPVVVLGDLVLVRDALKDERFAGRPQLRPFLERQGGKPKGILFNQGRGWIEQRRFAIKTLKDFGFGKRSLESIIWTEVDDVIKRLKKTEGGPVGLTNFFNVAVLNVLWHVLAGERHDHDDPRVFKLLSKISEVSSDNSVEGIFYFMPWVTKLAPNLSGYKTYLKSICDVGDYLTEQVKAHKKIFQPNHPRDFIDAYLDEIQRTTDPGSSFHPDVGDDELSITASDFMGAGTDTTSVTLSWAVLYAMLNPRIQDRIYSEIETVIGSRQPSLSDRPNMHFMQAFIAETLRLSSVAPIAVFHSITETLEFANYTLPKDTIVIANLWQIHHDEKYWGDPEVFRPERFLNELGEFKKDDGMLAFATGKRICPGESLARDDLFLFLTGLFQQFTFEPDSSRPAPSILDAYDGIIAGPKPFNVIVKQRQ